ncbi:unnamed protein product [Aureobasidium pullulans]|nr:unnamed protein product [Aureobasidium pullulans]
MSAGRGGEIGGNRYGVSVDVVKYMNDRSINTFRPLSEKWHRFLGLDSFNTSKGQKHMTPLVVVLPTRGGKSLLFMAPACLENAGVTIVIVPFRALINKLVSTAKEASVNSTEWHPGLTDPATLVFVSADRIIGSGFLSYRLAAEARSGSLRTRLASAAHYAYRNATADVGIRIRSQHGLSNETCRRGELEETTIGTCKRMQKHIGRNKGVIYCRSIDQCKDMAKELGCAYYYGGSIDNEDKLAVWMETGGLIVATSALGTGVDFPGIVFILHIDLPYGMIDYAQESGRAGRAGEEVDSIIIVEQGKVESIRQASRIRGLDEEIIAEFVTTRECRRQVMSRYLDGKIVECGAGDKNGKERETVEKTLDDLTDGCASCWMLAVTQNRGHEGNNDLWTYSAQDCTIRQLNDSGLGLSEDECNKFRQAIRYEKSTHSCHKCGIKENYNAADIVAKNSSREEEEAEEELDDVGDERTEESEDSRVQERLRMRMLQSKQTSGLEKV